MEFKFITHDFHDPYFNLASEEYLLKQKGGYYVYTWINSPAVIVGINQNTLQEVNLSYTTQHGIKVVRRLTGGGAVYHDLNNICYTVIAPYNSEQSNYQVFTEPVIQYLDTLGVKAELSGRNDIMAEGGKISGNAQTVYNGKIMHHGTLLFDTDMSALSDALIHNKLKTESKGIKSVRARVKNIADIMIEKLSVTEFYSGLNRFIGKNCERYEFSKEDIDAINQLVKDKYSTYEWNVGHSPKGKNRFDGRFSFGTLTLTFDTEDGLIRNAEIFGDFFNKKDVKILAEKLNGVRADETSVAAALTDAGDYIAGADGSEIAREIFG